MASASQRSTLSTEKKLEVLEALKTRKVEDVAPNTTSLIQPLDQGIIRTAKVHYRTQIMRKMINAIDNGTSIIDYAKSINLLKAMHMLKRAWFLVSPSTIENCFRKAGFSVAGVHSDVSEVQEEALDMAEFDEIVQESDFEALIDCDIDIDCFGNLNDTEICESVKKNQQNAVDEEEEEEEVEDETSPPISHKDALMHLSMIRKYLEENLTNYSAFYEVENMIEKNVFSNRSQRKMTDFFSKK